MWEVPGSSPNGDKNLPIKKIKKIKIGSFQISRRISLAHLVCVYACYLFLVNTKSECRFRSKKDLTCITYLYVCVHVHLCEVGRCWGGGLCRYMGMCIYKCFYISMYVFLYLSKPTCWCVCIYLCVRNVHVHVCVFGRFLVVSFLVEVRVDAVFKFSTIYAWFNHHIFLEEPFHVIINLLDVFMLIVPSDHLILVKAYQFICLELWQNFSIQ